MLYETKPTRLTELCGQIIHEKDPDRFTALALEINLVIENCAQKLRAQLAASTKKRPTLEKSIAPSRRMNLSGSPES